MCFSLFLDRDPNPLPSEQQHPDLQLKVTEPARNRWASWRLHPRLHAGAWRAHRCECGAGEEAAQKPPAFTRFPCVPSGPGSHDAPPSFSPPVFTFFNWQNYQMQACSKHFVYCWVWPKSRRNFIFFQFSNFSNGSLSFHSPANRKMLPVTFINWMKGHCGTLIPFLLHEVSHIFQDANYKVKCSCSFWIVKRCRLHYVILLKP